MAAAIGALIGTDTRAWVLTDGKAGDEEPCRAVVEALGIAPTVRRVSPGSLHAAFGLVDRRACNGWGPSPNIVVASGRRAIPYLRHLKRAAGGRTFTVFLKDPRRGTGVADLIWVPEHDRLRGSNVITTLTGPHALSAERLRASRRDPDPRLAGLPSPRVAVLVGGDSRHHRFTDEDCDDLRSRLRRLAESGARLMITPSRRTPPGLTQELHRLAGETGSFFWGGGGDNPYLSIVAVADALVVTTDSANMLGEAAATGRPILTFRPSGGHAKLDRLLSELDARGVTRAFTGSLEGASYPPLDATPMIAEAIAAGYARHRAGLAAV